MAKGYECTGCVDSDIEALRNDLDFWEHECETRECSWIRKAFNRIRVNGIRRAIAELEEQQKKSVCHIVP